MKMNNDQKKRAVTEFAALERDLDTILFRRKDDDEDRSSLPMAIAKAGAGTVAVGGATYGGLKGLQTLTKRGKSINEMPTATMKQPAFDAGLRINQIGSDASGRGQFGNITQPERRFTLPGQDPIPSTIPGKSKGVFGDLATGAKSFLNEDARTAGKQSMEGLSALFKKMFKRSAQAVA
jgi:hypothetical protein